jgi:hypothetical protein
MVRRASSDSVGKGDFVDFLPKKGIMHGVFFVAADVAGAFLFSIVSLSRHGPSVARFCAGGPDSERAQNYNSTYKEME